MSCAYSLLSLLCVCASKLYHLGICACCILVSWFLSGGIGLSIIALFMPLLLFFCTLGSDWFSLGDVYAVLFGGFVFVSKVTVGVSTFSSVVSRVVCFGFSTLGSAVWVSDNGGVLVSSSSRHFNDSICSSPFKFVLPLSACVRSVSAFTIITAGVTIGWVMYLCLNHTVSDILMFLVFLVYITWHL